MLIRTTLVVNLLGLLFIGCGDDGPKEESGACCLDNGSCSYSSREFCEAEGNTFVAVGTSCRPNPCHQPETVACCRDGISCEDVPEEECMFSPMGTGSSCATTPCEEPALVACCTGGGFCEMLDSAECDGTSQGGDSTCDPNPCCARDSDCLAGSYCRGDGVCTEGCRVEPDDCLESFCDPDTRTCLPLVACCELGGVCQDQKPGECQGVELSSGSSCAADVCPMVSACCMDGACGVADQDTCSGTFVDWVAVGCKPNPCCLADDDCPADSYCEQFCLSGCRTAPDNCGYDVCDPITRTCFNPREVAPGVYHLDGLDPNLPYDDLEPLAHVVGESTYVALGESVHTSAGYYKTKARFFRYLVEEKGYRSFAFENPWSGGVTANEYVSTCNGDPVQATSGLLFVWQAQTVVEILEWMCLWNQTHPDDPLTFFGFDIQQPTVDGKLLENYLQLAAPTDAAAPGIDHCLGVGFDSWDEFLQSPEGTCITGTQEPDGREHDFCLLGLEELRTYLATNEARLIAASSQEELDWAWVSLESLAAFEDECFYLYSDQVLAYEARDRGMAHLLKEIHRLTCPNEKVVVWAHNLHIGNQVDAVHGWGESQTSSIPWEGFVGMGNILAQDLLSDWTTVGITAHKIHIDWPGYGDPPIPTNPMAVEVQLLQLNEPYLFVDLRRGDEEHFFDPETDYQLAYQWMNPSEQFDALVFLVESPAMTYVYP